MAILRAGYYPMGIYEFLSRLLGATDNRLLREFAHAGVKEAFPSRCCEQIDGDWSFKEAAEAKLFSKLGAASKIDSTSAVPLIASVFRNLLIHLKLSDDVKRDKLHRLGLALSYRSCLDSMRPADSGNVSDLSHLTEENWNSYGLPLAKAWKSESGVEIDLAEAFWIWRGVFGQKPDLQPKPVTTRIVAKNTKGNANDPDGITGQLSVALIDWALFKKFDVDPPKWGFVRSPRSFSYYLNEGFAASFQNTKTYLSESVEPKIWSNPDWVVEWDVQLGPPGARMGSLWLLDGSAGAAIALATACLLAREH